MKHSLLFLPDISGYTTFVKATEISHSQHVIAELLEVLIEANTLDLQLAEIEGDALFFYKDGDVPNKEALLTQAQHMFNAFYSHLDLLKKNRICPCRACSMAPDLELKIIAHSGPIELITIHNTTKPFGNEVIEAHRLMKNSVASDCYLLMSNSLSSQVGLNDHLGIFNFKQGENTYDGNTIEYRYAAIDKTQLNITPIPQSRMVTMKKKPSFTIKMNFPVTANELLEFITNYKYRLQWAEGLDGIDYNENEITRVDTKHACTIDGKQLHFTTITKKGAPNELVYGELTTSIPAFDTLYQFFIITPESDHSCRLKFEAYFKVKSPVKRLMLSLVIKKLFKKKTKKALKDLLDFIKLQVK